MPATTYLAHATAAAATSGVHVTQLRELILEWRLLLQTRGWDALACYSSNLLLNSRRSSLTKATHANQQLQQQQQQQRSDDNNDAENDVSDATKNNQKLLSNLSDAILANITCGTNGCRNDAEGQYAQAPITTAPPSTGDAINDEERKRAVKLLASGTGVAASGANIKEMTRAVDADPQLGVLAFVVLTARNMAECTNGDAMALDAHAKLVEAIVEQAGAQTSKHGTSRGTCLVLACASAVLHRAVKKAAAWLGVSAASGMVKAARTAARRAGDDDLHENVVVEALDMCANACTAATRAAVLAACETDDNNNEEEDDNDDDGDDVPLTDAVARATARAARAVAVAMDDEDAAESSAVEDALGKLLCNCARKSLEMLANGSIGAAHVDLAKSLARSAKLLAESWWRRSQTTSRRVWAAAWASLARGEVHSSAKLGAVAEALFATLRANGVEFLPAEKEEELRRSQQEPAGAGAGAGSAGAKRRRRRSRTSDNPFVAAAMDLPRPGASDDDSDFSDLADFIVCKPNRDYKSFIPELEHRSKRKRKQAAAAAASVKSGNQENSG